MPGAESTTDTRPAPPVETLSMLKSPSYRNWDISSVPVGKMSR